MFKWLKFNPALSVYYNISPQACQYAIKGLLGMAIALYIAFLLDFDRPYWAMISAVFLQIRPESGQVIQKGLFQLLATVLAGFLALSILAFFINAPILVFISLTLLIFLLSSASVLAPSMNHAYLCAMIAITTVLVTIMPISLGTVTSNNIFEMAVQRVSEIGIGSICATVISMLLWPQRVRKTMLSDATDLVEKIFYSMSFFLNQEDKRESRHKALLEVINGVMVLEADTGPAKYEAPNGPKLARTAHLINQRTLTLIAELQVLGHFIREQADLIGPSILQTFTEFRQLVAKTLYTNHIESRQKDFTDFHRHLNQMVLADSATPLQHRAHQATREIVQSIRILLDALKALSNVDRVYIKAESIKIHHDLFLSTITGLRSACLFSIAALIWIASAWDMGFMMMVMPITYSITFASFPFPTEALKTVIKGILVAMPIAIIVLLILAAAPRDFEILIMVFSVPLFFGLLGFTNRTTIGYSLGFCLTYIIMVLPSNHMVFDPLGSFERALSILIGVCILVMLFRIIQEPNALIMRRRLISSTANDLAILKAYAYVDAEQWFNGRMIGRIQRLATYENKGGSNANSQLNLIELGLLGLNIGHVIMRIQRNVLTKTSTNQLKMALKNWQQALAGAFQAGAWGINDTQLFVSYSQRIYQLMEQSHEYSFEQLQQFEGHCSRLSLSLLRNAGVSEDQIIQLQQPFVNNLLNRAPKI